MTDRPKRPRDTNQLAKLVADLATGQAEPSTPSTMKKIPKQTLGGIKRAQTLSAACRSRIAKKASAARWAKKENSQT